MEATPSPPPPYRQIRAKYDDATITVYQAYNHGIATAAVRAQRLDASSSFSTTRMTWIKPSWAWMLYRSGYSYKDPGQSNILSLDLKRDVFLGLLRKSVVERGQVGQRKGVAERKRSENVRVQWDPERDVRLERLPYRSIQIGVPGALVGELVDGIVKIEDVTEVARELKRLLDDTETDQWADTELVRRGLVPEEEEFVVDAELKKLLRMEREEEVEWDS
ncbi:ATP-dependent RNA helicase DHX8 [Corynespora cassiicola Philippines]|uniref:ATP-dependent RNA helicase DHX8 n=1 Tax=Corynespora cassiicola Philippines TaxID=1448308 RepID=A0A2T2NPD4_CORCC|nr:ATP-dependent RNA helicase DHX8 [Corynespora cassiicola Philippines]